MNLQLPISFLPNMKTSRYSMASVKQFFQPFVTRHLAFALALGTPLALGAAQTGKIFATPEEAVAALVAATRQGMVMGTGGSLADWLAFGGVVLQ